MGVRRGSRGHPDDSHRNRHWPAVASRGPAETAVAARGIGSWQDVAGRSGRPHLPSTRRSSCCSCTDRSLCLPSFPSREARKEVVTVPAQGPRLYWISATPSPPAFPYRSAGHRRLPLDIHPPGADDDGDFDHAGHADGFGVPPSVQGVRVGVLHRAPGDHGAWHLAGSSHQSGGEQDRDDQKLVVNWLVRPRCLHLPFRVCHHVGDLQPLRQERRGGRAELRGKPVNNVQEDHPAGNRAGHSFCRALRVHPLLRRVSPSVLAAGPRIPSRSSCTAPSPSRFIPTSSPSACSRRCSRSESCWCMHFSSAPSHAGASARPASKRRSASRLSGTALAHPASDQEER